MTHYFQTIKRHMLLLLLFAGSLQSCQIYHNTTSHYNSYFLANERLIEVERKMFESGEYDYNNIFNVSVPIDTLKGIANKSDLEYCISKASNPIRYHKKSDWVDDCYILIGKARLYQGDLENAVKTFKFVNTSSKDPHARHAALIQLIHTYTFLKQYNNVLYIANYIKKDGTALSNKNLRAYYLAMGQYHRQIEDFTTAKSYVELAVPLAKGRVEKSRLHFLHGQLALMNNDYDLAVSSFEKSKKLAPDYAMEFHSRLFLSTAKAYTSDEQYEKALAYNKRAIKDEKNKDYVDRAYFELSQLYMYKGEVDKALGALNLSIQESTVNTKQKAYSYIESGKIYYDIKKDYANAAAYYDSASTSMTPDMKGYSEILKRAEILKEFSNYYYTVKNQDEYRSLVGKSDEELNAIFTEQWEAEKTKVIKYYKAKKKKERQQQYDKQMEQLKQQQQNGASAVAGWPFYAEELLQKSLNKFEKKWGRVGSNMKNVDNWRRSAAEKIDSTDLDQRAEDLDSSIDEKEIGDPALDALLSQIPSVQSRIDQVPNTPEKMAISDSLLRNALFNLGGIYIHKLYELPNGEQSLVRLADDYKDYEKVPEALYTLFITCQDSTICDEEVYKNRLLNDYPESFYAKLIKNPNLVEDMNKADKMVEDIYRLAFNDFENEKYQLAAIKLKKIRKEYPNHSFQEQTSLLEAMVTGKVKGKKAYIKALEDYIKANKGSQLIPYAQRMLTAAKKAK